MSGISPINLPELPDRLGVTLVLTLGQINVLPAPGFEPGTFRLIADYGRGLNHSASETLLDKS